MYIKSKYRAHEEIEKANFKVPVYTLYPTLVMGGNAHVYYSHISGGIRDYHKWARILRFFSVDGACHFIHTRDIAEIVWHLIANDVEQRKFVLGQEKMTVKQVIQNISEVGGWKVWFQIPLSTKFILSLTKLLRIKIDPWGMYCINHSEQVYQVTSPTDLNLTNHFPTFKQAIRDIEGIG